MKTTIYIDENIFPQGTTFTPRLGKSNYFEKGCFKLPPEGLNKIKDRYTDINDFLLAVRDTDGNYWVIDKEQRKITDSSVRKLRSVPCGQNNSELIECNIDLYGYDLDKEKSVTFETPEIKECIFKELDKKDYLYAIKNGPTIREFGGRIKNQKARISIGIAFFQYLLYGNVIEALKLLGKLDKLNEKRNQEIADEIGDYDSWHEGGPYLHTPLECEVDEVISTYKKDKDKFFNEFTSFVNLDWFEAFDLPSKTISFFENNFTYDVIHTEPWRTDSYTSRCRVDSSMLFRLNEDNFNPELKEHLKEFLLETINDLADRKRAIFTLSNGEENQRLSSIREKITLYVLGNNDLIKIANEISKKMKFVNYDSLKEISLTNLSKLESFTYFVDKKCRVVIISGGKFYKYQPIIPNKAPDFSELHNQIESEKDIELKKLFLKEQEIILKRIQLGISVKTMEEGEIYKGEEEYLKLRKNVSCLDEKTEYLKSIPLGMRDLYSRVCYSMKCRFPEMKNVFGHVDQTLLE